MLALSCAVSSPDVGVVSSHSESEDSIERFPVMTNVGGGGAVV